MNMDFLILNKHLLDGKNVIWGYIHRENKIEATKSSNKNLNNESKLTLTLNFTTAKYLRASCSID